LPFTCGDSAERGDACHRHRFAHARLGGGETRIAGLCGFDPRVQLRIVIGAPPVGGRPLRISVAARMALPASSEEDSIPLA